MTANRPAETAQHRVFLAVIAVSTAGVLPVFLLGGLAVQVRADLQFSEAAQGWVTFGYFGASALFSAVCGRVVERIGPTRGMRIAALLATAALVGVAASPTFPLLLAALAFGGFANALAQPGSNAFIVAGVPQRRNGLAFGVKQSAIPAATLLAGLAVPTVALTVGWRWAFVGAAAIALLAFSVVPRVTAPTSPTPAGRRAAGRRTAKPEAALSTLIVLGIGAGLGSAMANSLGAFLTSTAVDAGIAKGPAGLLLSVGSVVGLSMRLIVGWRADAMTGSFFRVVIGMLTAGSLGLALLAAGTPSTVLAGTAVSFGLGWAWPGLFNLAVVHHNRAAPAAATGITQTGTYAGSALGPLAFGYLVEHGSYRQAWLTFVVVTLAAAIVIEYGRRRIEHLPSRLLHHTAQPADEMHPKSSFGH